MPSRFNVNVRVGPKTDLQDVGRVQTPRRRGIALLCGCILLAGAILYLLIDIQFARYAVTGFVWDQTEGTVLDTSRTSTPSIQFSTSDGASHVFSEDYILLCGGSRSFCLIRTFNPGQVVPVVYDPSAPQRAFVHDWALISGVISWLLVAGAALLIALFTAVTFLGKPFSASIRLGNNPRT